MLNKVFQYCSGRHTAFCLAFYASGTTLHCFGKLNTTYITFMGTLLTFVFGHSLKEDIFKKTDANQ